MKNKNSYALLVFLFLCTACDFTPRLHKDILLAQQFVTSQRYEDAILVYQKILKENPSTEIKVKIYYQLGELYSTYLSNNLESLKYFQKVVEESQDPLWLVKAEEKIGEINFTYQRNYRESLKSYSTLSQFVPKLQNADFYEYRYAVSLKFLERSKEAREAFEKILTQPQHEYYTRSIFDLGSLYFQDKDWSTAVNYWLDYIKKEKRRDNIVQAKFLVANAYETMEELQKAYNLYYSILGEYPNTKVVRARLKSIYERRVSRKR